MKILSYALRGDMIAVTTDNAARREFVYPIKRFDNLGELKAEIMRSITHENARKLRSTLRLSFKAELDNEVRKNGP